MGKLPEYMIRDEKVECLNCGWAGTMNQLEESDVCPNCSCDGYLDVIEEDEEE
jgi:predicted Zn-ribbon and HTH transcriptional regulator